MITEGNMQKWEYLFINADGDGGVWKPRKVNDKELPNWKTGESLVLYANRLGKEGWELITAKGDYLVFKRPIE
jgi:hypothetical protein